MNAKRVIIAGGGISGLSAAFFLSRKASAENFPVKITVLEASPRFGGVLHTLSHEGLGMEAGADAFYAGRSGALDLCSELGLGEDLVPAASCFRRISLLKHQKSFLIPGFPPSFSALAGLLISPLLSFSGKCRMLREPFAGRSPTDGDESVADFIRRRFGEDFYREIAEPVIRGVYMTDPGFLSLRAVFSAWFEAERSHGSLAGYFLSEAFKKKRQTLPEFLTLRHGLEAIIKALVRELSLCELRTSSAVRECVHDGGWKVTLEDGGALHADVLCLAMNACDASRLVSRAAPPLSGALSKIRYDSILSAGFLYRAGDVPGPGPVPGFFVPATGEAASFSSLKWMGKTADGDHFSVRGFISKALQPDLFCEDPETIRKKMRDSLGQLFGVHAAPRFAHAECYVHALPQYGTGHLERVAGIEDMLRQHPGLYLAGNGFRGFGITDCIQGAKAVASRILENLQSTPLTPGT